jgi:hypothetical protein
MGVLQHAVGLALPGRGVLVPDRAVVHDGGCLKIESGIDRIVDGGGRGRGDEIGSGLDQSGDVAV